MSANDVSTILYSLLVVVSGVGGIINAVNYKEFKRLKTENELLKFKLKECEQRGT